MKRRKQYWIALIACLCLSVTILPVSAHYDTAYWNETRAGANNPNWMAQISDTTRVSQMSIPGTHDTMAHRANLLGADITRTQSMSLEQQLQSGIRYLDIRAKYHTSYFQIHHGSVNTGYHFDDVMMTTKQFLQAHPTETVFMRFKQEQSNASDDQMEQLFHKYYNRYKESFWNPDQSENRYNPQMKELRGKIVLISDVLSITEGLNYRHINKQDNYHVPNNWELYTKWNHVKQQLHVTSTLSKYNDTIYMNYLSGSGGSFPYFVASGHTSPGTGASRLATGLTEPGFHSYYPDFPRVNWFGVFATIAFEGINTLTANWIAQNKPSYVGFVVADFPGERLIEQIIRCNFNKLSGEYQLSLNGFPNDVVDFNQEDGNITMWQRNNGNNQAWILDYDHDVHAYKIRSKVNRNIILAWNDYRGSKNVFATQDQSKQEHYWILEEKQGGYIFHNFKDPSLILTTTAPDQPYNGLNLIVRVKYGDDRFDIFQLR